MNPNLYQLEQTFRQHHLNHTDELSAQPHDTITRSTTVKPITRTIIAVLAALTILGAAAPAAIARQESTQQVASLCCIRRP